MKKRNGRREEGGSLEQRLEAYPELRQGIEEMLGVVENSEGDVVKADEAEQRLIEYLRQMGQAALQGWAERKQERVEAEYEGREDVTKKNKKKSLGTVDLE